MASTIEMLNEELNRYKDNPALLREMPIEGVPSLFNKYTYFVYSKASLGSSSGKMDSKLLFDNTQTPTSVDSKLSGLEKGNMHSPIAEAVDGALNKLKRPQGSNRYSDAATAFDKYKVPTASTIIEFFKNQTEFSVFGPMPYSWSDFLYCKHYGLVTNNHMITLRRYPLPIWDNAKAISRTGDPLPPIAQAVTFMGETCGNKLSEIMSMNWGFPWKEIEARVQDVAGNEMAFGDGIEGAFGSNKIISKIGPLATAIRGDFKRWSGQLEKEQEWQKGAFASDGPYWNQVLGPVNVVNKSHMRDMGLNFKQTIKIKFEYSLRSYNFVNPKVAMLDLISNFIMLTFNNAKFWGGAIRYFPNVKPQVKFIGDQDAFYSGKWDDYFSSLKTGLSDMFSRGADALANIFSGKVSLKEVGTKLLNMGLDLGLGNLQQKNRPHILSIRNLLSGDPIGEWHLTIGNPLNPIAMMGNMLVDDVTMTFGETLGADDFPTEVEFVVTLKHGRPRDKGDIESIFNYGNGRMYYSGIEQPLPSEKGTYGDAYQKYVSNYNRNFSGQNTAGNGDQISTSDVNGSKISIFNRVNREWGSSFANSNLTWILEKVKGKF